LTVLGRNCASEFVVAETTPTAASAVDSNPIEMKRLFNIVIAIPLRKKNRLPRNVHLGATALWPRRVRLCRSGLAASHQAAFRPEVLRHPGPSPG
jgi:hypothetical protein